MNIKDLEYFVALSQTGSFRKAAAQCSTSQPTISNSITRTEKELGTLLFNRTTRSLALTSKGVEILVCAQAVLKNVNLMREIASSHDALKETVNLGLTTSIAHYFYAKVINSISNLSNKTVKVHEVKKENLSIQLNSGVTNCLIIACDECFNGYEKHLVAKFPYVLAVSKEDPLAQHFEIGPSDLEGRVLLNVQEDHSFESSQKKLMAKYQLNIQKELIFYSMEVLKMAIKQKKGIALIPEYAAKKEEDITYIPLINIEITKNIYLIHKNDDLDNEFYEHLAFRIGEAIVSY